MRELMDDPLTRAVMQRDGLTVEQGWVEIREAQRKLLAQSAGRSSGSGANPT